MLIMAIGNKCSGKGGYRSLREFEHIGTYLRLPDIPYGTLGVPPLGAGTAIKDEVKR